MPTIRRVVSTDQPARYLALTAIIVACLAGALAYAGASVLAHRVQRDENETASLAVQNCKEIQRLEAVTRRALGAAVERARHALPNPAARASITELRAEIALLAPHACS